MIVTFWLKHAKIRIKKRSQGSCASLSIGALRCSTTPRTTFRRRRASSVGFSSAWRQRDAVVGIAFDDRGVIGTAEQRLIGGDPGSQLVLEGHSGNRHKGHCRDLQLDEVHRALEHSFSETIMDSRRSPPAPPGMRLSSCGSPTSSLGNAYCCVLCEYHHP